MRHTFVYNAPLAISLWNILRGRCFVDGAAVAVGTVGLGRCCRFVDGAARCCYFAAGTVGLGRYVAAVAVAAALNFACRTSLSKNPGLLTSGSSILPPLPLQCNPGSC